MTVAELIEKLKTMPQDMEIRIFSGDPDDSFSGDAEMGEPEIHPGAINGRQGDFVLLGCAVPCPNDPEDTKEPHDFQWSSEDLTDLCGHRQSDGDICGQHRCSIVHGWKPPEERVAAR